METDPKMHDAVTAVKVFIESVLKIKAGSTFQVQVNETLVIHPLQY